MQIAAGPESGSLLQGAVAEKGDKNFFGSGNAEDLFQGKGPGCRLLSPAHHGPWSLFPQRQAEDQNQGQKELENRNDPVAGVPAHASGQGKSHDIRSSGGANAPHAVEPAHMPAFVMERYIVVQRGVHASGSQTVGNGPQAEHPERGTDRKTKEGRGSDPYADCRHLSRSQLPGKPVALQAGDNGTQGNNHGQDPRIGDRHLKLRIDRRPG